ncbi:hypothetical protein V8F33_010033 [Rhypophila sp. PSN 637]
MATMQQCPVVGTINSTLPPSHPDIDLSKPGQTCPVHPNVAIPEGESPADASACPVITGKLVNAAKSKEMDDEVCPIVGTATTVLPPDHPSTADKSDDVKCPVTKAKVGHHKGKLHGHPDLSHVAAGAVCPVAGTTVQG